jgi:hypothetical protein
MCGWGRAAETTHPNHVVDAALAHAINDKMGAAHWRGDLFEKRATDGRLGCLPRAPSG